MPSTTVSASAARERAALLETLQQALVRHYLILLVPAAVLALLGAVLRQAGGSVLPSLPVSVSGPAVLVAAVVLALAGPLWVRGRFVARVAASRSVDTEPFLGFERNQLNVSLPATWVAALAYLLGVPLFYFAGAMLAALYAGYFYFPSQQRVAHEMRLFRVGPAGREERDCSGPPLDSDAGERP